jgi:hypothetical protein
MSKAKSTKSPSPRQPVPGNADSPDIQGEGNYDATRRYDKAASDFAKSGKVDEAARAAQPRDAREAEQLQRAEQAGRSRSKGEDAAGTEADDDEGDTLTRR